MEGVTLRDEFPEDVTAREAILDAALGADRRRKSSERIREGRLPALAVVAQLSGSVAGTVRLWHAEASGLPLLLLGPLAVRPDLSGRGIGGLLMKASLRIAAEGGHGAAVLVGDPDYYARFGFSAAAAANLSMPGPFERHRLQALEFRPGWLASASGTIHGCGAGEAARGAESRAA